MPFCADCDRFYNPNTLDGGGNCPDGHHVEDPAEPKPVPKVPWHFKVMLAFLIAYMGFRLYQLILWGIDKIF